MKFSASLPDFHKMLQKALPAIPPKTTMPILEHLHLALEGDILKVIATDQEITIRINLSVEGQENGSVLVPGRRLNDIIKAQDLAGSISFSTDPETFDITLKTSSGKYQMKGLNSSEYLEIPELFKSETPDFDSSLIGSMTLGNKVSFKKEDMIFLSGKTGFAVSHDEYRPAMTGVLFQFRGNYVKAAATDSYRLVVAKIKSDESVYPAELDIIIPSRTIDLLKKIDSDTQMSIIESKGKFTHARFDLGDMVLITKVIDEKFPPYESVIPNTHNIEMTVSKEELAKAISRVSIQTSTISRFIKIEFEPDSLMITGRDEDTGTIGNEKVTCEFNGDKFEIGFNFKYLLECVDNVDVDPENKKVGMYFTEPNRPVILKSIGEDDKLFMLVMPVRVN